mgnify:CR=1 FL=1
MRRVRPRKKCILDTSSDEENEATALRDDAQAAAEAEAEAAQAQADEFEMGGLDEPPTPSGPGPSSPHLSLIHISEPTRPY